MVVFLPFWWSRTPTFHSLLFSGYVFVFLIHYVSYFPCFLVFAYPDISFLTFFGVHFRFTHTLCFIFSLLFSGFVPRYFIFRLFRGTFPSFSYIMFHIFLAFWWSRTPIFHFFIFLWVCTFSYITYCGFSTLLFTENVPQHFIFNISRGTLLNCLTYFPPPLCTKGYRVALASTRYPSTNSLTFYIHISIYQYSSLLPAFSPLLWHTATFRFNEYLPHLCCHFYI